MSALPNLVRLTSVANLAAEINEQARGMLCGYVDMSLASLCCYTHGHQYEHDIIWIYPRIIHRTGRVIPVYPRLYPHTYPRGRVSVRDAKGGAT